MHFIINSHPCFLDAPERFPRHCPWNLCRRPRRSSAGSLKGYVCVCLEVSTRAIRFWSVLSFFAWIRALKRPAMIRLKIIRFLLFSCGLISWELGFVYLYITWSRAGYGYTTLVLAELHNFIYYLFLPFYEWLLPRSWYWVFPCLWPCDKLCLKDYPLFFSPYLS